MERDGFRQLVRSRFYTRASENLPACLSVALQIPVRFYPPVVIMARGVPRESSRGSRRGGNRALPPWESIFPLVVTAALDRNPRVAVDSFVSRGKSPHERITRKRTRIRSKIHNASQNAFHARQRRDVSMQRLVNIADGSKSERSTFAGGPIDRRHSPSTSMPCVTNSRNSSFSRAITTFSKVMIRRAVDVRESRRLAVDRRRWRGKTR